MIPIEAIVNDILINHFQICKSIFDEIYKDKIR